MITPDAVKGFMEEKDISLWKIIELGIIGAALGYNTYVNANQVPMLKDSLNEVKTKVAVLENSFENIEQSLTRIENKLER